MDESTPVERTPSTEGLRDIIRQEIAEQLKTGLFTARKLTDNPTDDIQVVNRRYVTMNGTIALRPASVIAVKGQTYYATDLNIPLTYDGTNWRNGTGSIIATN